jgi:acyl carrier protein
MKEKIKEIMKNELDVPEEKLLLEDKPLTGEDFLLQPRDMVYLFFLIEKEFRIRIEIQEIVHYEFATIAGIAAIVERKCRERNGGKDA